MTGRPVSLTDSQSKQINIHSTKRSMPFEARCEAKRSRAVHNMYYVYLLKSLKNPSKTYIGYTINIDQRLDVHNSGGSTYTKLDRPWKLVTYLAFDSQEKAIEFEKYIKVGSGNAFAKRRLW